MLAGLGAVEEDHLRFSATQVGLLDALLEDEVSVEVDAKFLEIRDRLRSFEGVTPGEEPAGFKGTLRPYQKDGLGWLRFLQDFHFGGCLADDMGLGKTVQLLALLLERSRLPDRRPSLIVVPKSLMFNWVQEIQRFTPELTYVEYTGLQRAELRDELAKTNIVLTTYGTLRRDVVSCGMCSSITQCWTKPRRSRTPCRRSPRPAAWSRPSTGWLCRVLRSRTIWATSGRSLSS